MDVLILLIFVSLVLVVGALLFLLVRIRGGDFEHIDRLPFLPLEPDQRSDARVEPGSDPSSVPSPAPPATPKAAGAAHHR